MIHLQPIGVVRNGVTQAHRDTRWDEIESEIILDDEWRDALDGTPALDLKPYLECGDAIRGTRVGAWAGQSWAPL